MKKKHFIRCLRQHFQTFQLEFGATHLTAQNGVVLQQNQQLATLKFKYVYSGKILWHQIFKNLNFSFVIILHQNYTQVKSGFVQVIGN